MLHIWKYMQKSQKRKRGEKKTFGNCLHINQEIYEHNGRGFLHYGTEINLHLLKYSKVVIFAFIRFPCV